MKVNIEKIDFKPVTIVLETEAEVLFIAKLLGAASCVVAEEFGVDEITHSKTYKVLEAIVGIEKYRSHKGLLVHLSKH